MTRRLCLLALAALTLLTACGGDDIPSEPTDATSDTNVSDGSLDTRDDATDDTSTPSDACDTDCAADTTAQDTSDSDTAGSDTADSDTADTDTMTTELPPQPWSVHERGHYNVGYRQTEITYLDGAGQERTVGVDLWYPSEDASGSRVSYLIIESGPGTYYGATPAEVPAGEAGFPVMVFSHGSGGFPAQSFFWTEYLASHGWVVAAPEHVGNSTATGGSNFPPEIFFQRPQDVIATLDYVLETDVDGTGLDAIVDAERVAVSGHSFGGYTSLAVAGGTYQVDLIKAGCDAGQVPQPICDSFTMHEQLFRDGFGDDRIDAIVPMSPGGTLVFGAGLADIDIPVMLMTGSMDQTTPDSQDGDPAWSGLDGADDLRVQFETGAHFTFSNACDLAASLGENDGCGPQFIPTDVAHPVIDAYGLAFLREHLELTTDSDAQAILDPATSLHDDVVLVTPEP